MSADEAVDFFDEVGGGLEGATTDGAFGDEGEEALDLVEPGGVGRGEVNVPTRPAGEPSPDLGMLVGGVVVVISRPVFSAVRYMQMVGRGLRGPKNGGTEICKDHHGRGQPIAIWGPTRLPLFRRLLCIVSSASAAFQEIPPR